MSRRPGSRPRRQLRTPPPVRQVDEVRVVAAGTAVWALALVALLPFWGRLRDDDRLWWLGTCAVGIALGLWGIHLTRRRRQRRPPDAPEA